MWIVRWWQAVNRADAIVAIEQENVMLRAALSRAYRDFEAILDELTYPATVRRLPESDDQLWRAVRDRARVARDEARRTLEGKAA